MSNGAQALEPPLGDSLAAYRDDLAALARRDRRRTLRPRVGIDFASNDYLGLAADPRVRRAFVDGLERWGVGAGASRLVSGNMTVHRRLEEQLSDFKCTEACLLFGSGYLANTGIVAALAREGDVVLSDALGSRSCRTTTKPNPSLPRVSPRLAGPDPVSRTPSR